jgi:hypothetical protein
VILLALTGQANAQDAGPTQRPPVDESGGNPHGRTVGAGGPIPGMFQPPKDSEQEDPTLAPGTIAVDLRDADDNPVAHESVTLGILINSVAKGDSRKHLQGTTDDGGHVVFSGLETASNIAYRVSTGYQGGLFGAMPFQLQQAKAMRVTLHVYPVTRDIQQAMIVCELTLAAEVRDDRIQIEEALAVYNLGRTAWQPDDVRMALPAGFVAFNAPASMSDQGVDDVGGAAKLRGTFAPGQHSVEFRWQLPWSGDSNVDFNVGVPPHVAIARVLMPATGAVQLVAAGFPPAEIRQDAQGQSFRVTERHVRPEEARITSLAVGIHDLPNPGPGKWLASLLAACGVIAGVYLSVRGRSRDRESSPNTVRDRLLGQLEELERAHKAGDVGPKTYERARREIVDAIARTLVAA